MTGQPCQNRSCKSYGKPHPNCACYGAEMAEGGFCDETREHGKDCQYFADGGAPDQPQKPMMFDDLVDDNQKNAPQQQDQESGSPLQFDDLVDDAQSKYTTTAQKIGAGLEGAAQGFAGPLATVGEKLLSKAGVPGLTDEDIKQRAEQNPLIHGASEAAGLGAGLYTGVGELGWIAKGAGALTKAAELGEAGSLVAKAASGVGNAAKFLGLSAEAAPIAGEIAAKAGSSAIKGAIEGGLLQAGDNASKAMLGQGDPGEPVANVLLDGLGPSAILGGMVGGLGGVASKGLETLANSKSGTALHTFLGGVGEAMQGVKSEDSAIRELNPTAWDNGVKWWNRKIYFIGAPASIGAYEDVRRGYQEGNLGSGLEDAALDLLKGAGLTAGIKVLSKPAAAAILKAIGDGERNPRALFQMIDYANQANSGAQKLTKGVENLFNAGGQKTIINTGEYKNMLGLDKYIDQGGVNQDIQNEMENQQQQPPAEGFAEGGEVKSKEANTNGRVFLNHPIEKVYPEQNILLQQAKGRISNYLTSLKPQKNAARLAFDPEPDTHEQEKTYKKALKIAVQPLSVLQHIKDGTIEPEHIKHLNSMYPEATGAIQKKVTESIIQAQLKGQKPNYTVRQGLSMLMGTPLSSEFTPQNIQAAQSAFQTNQPQQQGQQAPPTKNKKGTSSLTKFNQAYLTGNQSLAMRQQKL